jgi:drug/metabolite transporter (DMT)-like permease
MIQKGKDDIMEAIFRSIKKNYVGIIFILVSSFTLAAGQLFWKISAGENLYFLALGFALYGSGAILMIIAYKHGSLSVLHPMMSASYIFAFIIGYLFLNENIGLGKTVGLVFIILGCFLIGGGDDN